MESSLKNSTWICPECVLPDELGAYQFRIFSSKFFLQRFSLGFPSKEVSEKISRPEKFKPEIVPRASNEDNPGLKTNAMRGVSYSLTGLTYTPKLAFSLSGLESGKNLKHPHSLKLLTTKKPLMNNTRGLWVAYV